jgi:hypothetical protein
MFFFTAEIAEDAEKILYRLSSLEAMKLGSYMPEGM